MIIYLAGPMSGIPHFNFPAFHRAAWRLRAQGHTVFNPAEWDIKKYGDISEHNTTGDVAQAANDGFNLREALAKDTQFICMEADAIALLPGWEYSSGAIAEWALGRAFGHKFIYLREGEF